MQCPGQDSRFWKTDAIYEARCPQCGRDVEFFKDDTARKCPACGHRFVNPELDFGCAAYCQFAEQCLGSLPGEFKDMQQDMQQSLLKDKVRMEVRRSLGEDGPGIRRAADTAAYAERLGKDVGGDLGVILMAASLAGLARQKAGQGQDGPDLARGILEKLGAKPEVIDQVCDILGRLDLPGPNEDLNFQVAADALSLAAIEDAPGDKDAAQDREALIKRTFFTSRARELAREKLADFQA